MFITIIYIYLLIFCLNLCYYLLMLDLMILYVIYEYELSMYLILKRIHEIFGDFSKPSFGAIRPALTKLENDGFIKSRKTFSDGGKQTGYYIITSDGKKALKMKLFENLSSNPVQFKSNSAIKIIISEILPKEQQEEVFNGISKQIEMLKIDAEKKLQKNLKFYQKILIDNLIVEYDNYLKLLSKIGK